MKKARAIKGTPKKKAGVRGQMPASKNAVELRREIEDLVRQEAVPMVDSTIAEAKDGHFAAMKYLFEMIGLFPGMAEAVSEEDDSLAKILLQRLGMTDVTPGTSEVSKEISTMSDAVE